MRVEADTWQPIKACANVRCRASEAEDPPIDERAQGDWPSGVTMLEPLVIHGWSEAWAFDIILCNSQKLLMRMKRIAIVGFGFMGRTHYGAWKKCRGAQVVAICDSNLAQLTAKVKGNIAGVADNAPIPKSVKIYDDFRKMLASGGFDIVDITLPTLLHPKMTIAALKAGYHVLFEKPMALKLSDCDRMLKAAKAARRELMIAHCVRFFPENAYVRDLVRSGKYGRLVSADFSRFIAPPKWSPKGADWFFDERKSGGVLFDVHVHDADYIAGTFGMPKRIFSVAHRNGRRFVDHTTTTYFYKDAFITSDSSFAAASSLVWEASGRVFFEKATVYFGPMYKGALTVYPDGGKAFSPKLPSATGYEAEIAHFLKVVEGRVHERILTVKDARDAIALLLLERESAKRQAVLPVRV